MNYVANKFLLVSSSVRSKQVLCFVQKAKKENKKPTTKHFIEFYNHSPLLIGSTMAYRMNKRYIPIGQ